MLTALDVAKYFLALADEDEEPITKMKLQKLLYYAQGVSLAVFDEPLFLEAIQAWTHGPVVPTVYHSYKDYGHKIIPCEQSLEQLDFEAEVEELLDEVFTMYGQFTASKLREMTHNEAPWREAPKGQEISRERIKAYFKTEHNLSYHSYSQEDLEMEEIILKRTTRHNTSVHFVLASDPLDGDDDLENRILLESGILPKLLENASTKQPIEDWKTALDAL